ncbi:MAG: PAS domain S-box protein [Gammaproteobacteria bacterium]|nr:PAS domain S-box protein [Gammaproteobacteria bacterium]
MEVPARKKLVVAGHYIVWLIWALAALSVAMAAGMWGVVEWTLADIRQERQAMMAEEKHSAGLAQQLDKLILSGRSEFIARLDPQTDTQAPKGRDWLQSFQALLRVDAGYRYESGQMRKMLRDMRKEFEHLQPLFAETAAWRSRYERLSRDIDTKRNTVRSLIQELRDTAEAIEERQSLKTAELLRQYQRAESAQAADLARRIVDAGWQKPRRQINVRNELAKLALLTERLAVENEPHQLAEIKDKRLVPSLARVKQGVKGLTGLNEKLPLRLETALFGRSRGDVAEQIADSGEHGLFALRKKFLWEEAYRGILVKEIDEIFHLLRKHNDRIQESSRHFSGMVSRHIETAFFAIGEHLVFVGILASAVFLVLVIIIVRTVRWQVGALEAGERRNRLIVDTALDAMIGMNENGKVIGWNRRAESAFGRSRAEALGRPLYNLIIPKRFQQAHNKALERFRNSGGRLLSLRMETVAQHRDGHEFPVELSVVSYRYGEGYAFSAFMRDITQRKQAQDTLEGARKAAEEANLAKSRFLANMSHELRTPLNAIIGYSEILLEDVEDAGLNESSADLEKITLAGRHLLALINDVLDISKIEAGNMALHNEEFDVAVLARQITGTVHPLIDKKGNLLQVRCADSIGKMYADLTKVRQILLNLLSNAAKFTKEGTIVLEFVRISEEHDEWMIFRVSDTGIGIAPEKVSMLFQVFTQADASSTRQYGGTGLGLVICKRFAEMMGGSISVESEPNRGTAFQVHLPVGIMNDKL